MTLLTVQIVEGAGASMPLPTNPRVFVSWTTSVVPRVGDRISIEVWKEPRLVTDVVWHSMDWVRVFVA